MSDMSGKLTYLHLVATPLLFLPLLSLFTPPRTPPPELPGIRPITIRRVTPRRGFILTFLILLAVTSFLDGVLLIVDLLTASSRDGSTYLFREELGVASWAVYSVGALIIWSMAAILAEYRTKWGDRGIVTLVTLGFLFEIPNLVLTIIAATRATGQWRILSFLAIVPSALRILILPLLFVVVSSPKISYEPAEETSSLLVNTDDAETGPARGREAYGTFTNGDTEASTSRDASAAPPTGVNTPAGGKGAIVIPKQLGAVKKEDKPLDWREVMVRIRKLSPYLWPSTSRRLQFHVFLCVLLLIAGRILQPMLPLSLGRIVRALTQNQGGRHGTSPWPAFIAYFVIRVTVSGSGLLYFVQQRLWIPVSQFTDREMMMMCFNHLLNLSLAYHTKRNTGEVLKVIDRGSAINNLFQTVLFTALPTVFDIIIAFGIFWYLYGALLAGMTLIVMTSYLFISVTATQRRAITRRQLMDRDIKQRGIISDVLTNWESVKYFTAEHRETNRFREAIVSYQETEAKWNVDYQLLYLIQTFLLSLGLLSGSLLIAYRVLHGTSDAAEFVVYIQYFQQLASPLDRLGFLYQQLNRNSIDAEKMFTLLSEKTEINDKPDAKELVITDGVVEFDNVRFSYDGKVPALKGVSFKINKGESMALVGESGSGKSTVLRLLYRFYDVDSGVIRIDGQDISQVTQVSLRKAIGIVPQDSVLWNDTIGANISYGKEGAEDDEIILAAHAAKLHERILGFSEGYSTVVGERGVRLSGGEKQRVSLARMFLKSPAILVLDEATSALDTETEREIQRALSDLAKGRTSLSIAHRLSTIINSDQIVVMKDGQVIENGGYKALLDQDGAFASMWKKQIFTEAEMMAQAGDGDLIDLRADNDGPKAGGSGGPEAPLEITATQEEVKQAAEELKENRKDGEDRVTVPDAQAHGVKPQETDVKAQATATKPQKPEASLEAYHKPDQHDGVVQEHEAKGFDVVDSKDEAPTSSAEIVKAVSETEASSKPVIIEEQSNLEQVAPPVESVKVVEPETQGHSPPALPTPSAPATESPRTDLSSLPSPSSSRQRPVSWAPSSDRTTPDKRLSFPRMTSSQSHASGISDVGSGSTTPSRSNSRSELPEGEENNMGDKARKRLNSIKGFVRRLSDQGLSRSPSLGGKGAKSPMGEMDEGTAMAGASLERLASEPESASGSAPPPAASAQSGNIGGAEQGGKNGKGKDGKKKKKKNGKGKK